MSSGKIISGNKSYASGTYRVQVLQGGTGFADGEPQAYWYRQGNIVEVSLGGWVTTIANPTSQPLVLSLPFTVSTFRGHGFMGYCNGTLRGQGYAPSVVFEYPPSKKMYLAKYGEPDAYVKGDTFGTNTWQVSIWYFTEDPMP